MALIQPIPKGGKNEQANHLKTDGRATTGWETLTISKNKGQTLLRQGCPDAKGHFLANEFKDLRGVITVL